MSMKAWLWKISHAPDRIQSRQEELKELRMLRESITVPLQQDKIQSSKQGNRTEELTAQIIDIEQSLRKDIAEFLIERARAIHLIESLDDPEQVEVLTLRYIQRLSWPDIQLQTHFSRSKVFKLHREGLKGLSVFW